MVREMVNCVVREVISWMASANEVEEKSFYFSTTDTLQTMFTNCFQVEGFRDSSSVTLVRTQSPTSELSHPPQGPVTLLRVQSRSSESSHTPQGAVTLLRARSPSSELSRPLHSPLTLLTTP
jgi:hypothetical protein